MKTIKGRYPERRNEDERVGNSDCKLGACGKQIIDLVGEYVHAIRVEDDVSSIRRDTMYMAPNVNVDLTAIGDISLTFNASCPTAYDAMVTHMENRFDDCCNEFFELGNIRFDRGETFGVIRLILNGKLCGYYIPEMNSWLLGNWSWHDHYITIVMAWIWPQIVSQLNLKTIENSVNGSAKQPKSRVIVSVGADPEFEVKRNGKVVKADVALNIRNYTSTDIGLDGAASQLEFRPKPGTPQQVVKHTRHLVKKFSEQYPTFDLTDEGNKYPLGGHIHVGIGHPIDCDNGLVALLDDFIGKPTLRLSGKARGSYQYLSMVRSQPHGFEYRSTPSAVFQNPMITHITLKLLKTLCERYFNGETISYHDIPSKEDYINVGNLTKRQTEYFMEFCNNYKPQKSIRESWKVKPADVSLSEIFHPEVSFRDEWDPEVERHIREDVQELNIDNPINIVFYGLNRERGEYTCTIPIAESRALDRPFPRQQWDGNTLQVGLSRDFRMRGLGRTRRLDLVQKISQIITEFEARRNA